MPSDNEETHLHMYILVFDECYFRVLSWSPSCEFNLFEVRFAVVVALASVHGQYKMLSVTQIKFHKRKAPVKQVHCVILYYPHYQEKEGSKYQ